MDGNKQLRGYNIILDVYTRTWYMLWLHWDFSIRIMIINITFKIIQTTQNKQKFVVNIL